MLLLHANDTIALAESEFELQKALKVVHEYCEMGQIAVDTEKLR